MVVEIRFIDALLSAVLCGLTLHFLFNRFEKQYLSMLKRLLWLAPLVPSCLLLSHYPGSLLTAVWMGYFLSYSTLVASIILYRISPIHPLAQYPGPILAKCTKFWGVYHSATGKMHVNLLMLHRRYGPVIRTGPNELSFCDLEAIQPVLGTHGMSKGPIWDGRRSPKNKHYALIGIRDTTLHLQRRRPWNKAFSVSGVRKYEPILAARLKILVEIISTHSIKGEIVDMAELLSCFSYDFMGDMAFGGGFELMRHGDVEGLWKLMEGGVRVQAFTQHIPWASPILYGLPGMGKAAAKLITFVINMSKNRIKRAAAVTGEDLSSYLLDENSPSPNPLSFGDYSSDAFLAIVAGSDTAATVLSCVLFYIISDGAAFTRLRKEIDDNFPYAGGQLPVDDTSKLANLPFLNAVINEALRLQPPVPTGLQRAPDVGTGGRSIGSNFIPEGTGVFIPPYAIHRDVRYFNPKPDTFWPDRWLNSSPDVETNQAAFIPYSIGPMNCAGKLLAQMELRVVVATLVQTFDMNFNSDWNPSLWEYNLEDYFVFKKGRLPIIVSTRSR